MDFSEAARINAERLPLRFAEGQARGAAYMLECRDMWDAHDSDAGVYWKYCASEAEVAAELAAMPDDSSDNRVLGVYDLSRPLAVQFLGIPRQEWLDGKRLR